MPSLYQHIANQIEEATGQPFELIRYRPISGGCINRAVLLEAKRRRYFVKMNRTDMLSMFEAEAQGISAIEQTNTISIPGFVCLGRRDDTAYLVLQYVEMTRAGTKTMQAMGSKLAALHRTTAPRFGWHIDNNIGSTSQSNRYTRGWVEFLREHRLGHQLKLAAGNGLETNALRRGERLLTRLEDFFVEHEPIPSLLHGDLWGGNFAAGPDENPVVFDPAVYFGDREADLAMTELFGGFSSEFYSSYEAAWPVDDGYRRRKILYNLYHVLNHFNLFGGGYGAQAYEMMLRLTED